MRILFTAISFPYPPVYGHRLRNWALLRGLREEGHQVGLVSFARPEDRQHHSAFASLCHSVRLVSFPGTGANYWSHLRSLPTALPEGVLRFRSKAMAEAIAAEVRENAPDIIICDDIYILKNIPPGLTIPVVLNKHDVHSLILKRYSEFQRNPAVRAYAWLQARKLWRWEIECVRLTARAMCCSRLDASIIRSACPEARLVVVPNAIDADTYGPVDDPDGDTLVYTGSMDWPPNRDAVLFFLREIFPLVRRRVPGATLAITGAHPGKSFLRQVPSGSNLEFTGFVPDIRTVLARSRVCVVPLRIGSGTRLKILEAAAMARPVVSTRLGAEGLDFVDGSEILLADEPQAFADAVVDLLSDRARRDLIGKAARRKVESDYGVPAVRRGLQTLLER